MTTARTRVILAEGVTAAGTRGARVGGAGRVRVSMPRPARRPVMEMPYRRLGRSGLRVSVLSFGSWVSFGPQLDVGRARDCLAAAYDAGVNFFDNAEAYSGGESERIMGEAIAALGWP